MEVHNRKFPYFFVALILCDNYGQCLLLHVWTCSQIDIVLSFGSPTVSYHHTSFPLWREKCLSLFPHHICTARCDLLSWSRKKLKNFFGYKKRYQITLSLWFDTFFKGHPPGGFSLFLLLRIYLCILQAAYLNLVSVYCNNIKTLPAQVHLLDYSHYTYISVSMGHSCRL